YSPPSATPLISCWTNCGAQLWSSNTRALLRPELALRQKDPDVFLRAVDRDDLVRGVAVGVECERTHDAVEPLHRAQIREHVRSRRHLSAVLFDGLGDRLDDDHRARV